MCQKAQMTAPIIFYFDLISPFARLGAIGVERLAAELGRPVEWRPVLIGITILEIMGMKPLPLTPLKGPYLKRDLERLSEWLGVPVPRHNLTKINSVTACRAFLLLKREDEAAAQRFGRAVFERLFSEGRDITRIPDVMEAAEAAGVASPSLEAALAGPEAKDMLRRAVDEAVAAGVFGVPTFVADGEMFWGNDHLWMLEHWVRHHDFRARGPGA